MLSIIYPGAASKAGDGAQRGGEKQGEASAEPPGAHRIHSHAEDYTDLHAQPLQSESVCLAACFSSTRSTVSGSGNARAVHVNMVCFSNQHEALGPQYEEFPTPETDSVTGCTGMQRLGAKLG